ncbi:MAG TPA: RNA 2',3'-cyclic phosphodiesterase [Pyrinomonadaceae bacterium]|jgi:2'-5' RNA ligase
MNQDETKQSARRAEQWRVFCAVEIPDALKAEADNYIARLRRDAPHADARWERTEKLHITLKFLGEITPSRADDLARAAARAASSVAPFSLAVKGTGAFPPRGMARALWLGIEDASGGLAGLQQRFEDECAHEGFTREQRPFHPHLTIARLRTPASTRALAELHRRTEFESEAFGVEELVVMRSELGAGGSRYTALSRHKLAGV